MRPSLFLAAFAAANGVAASRIPNTNYLDDVSSYLGSLAPVAKDVLLNKIAGPSIGADVGLRPVFVSLPILDANVVVTLFSAWCRHNPHPRGRPPRLPHLLASRCLPWLSRLACRTRESWKQRRGSARDR